MKKGLTLIDIMLALVIIAIIMAIAIPVRKSMKEKNSPDDTFNSSDSRFTIKEYNVRDKSQGYIQIITDTDTGVKYLFRLYPNSGGLTPLIEPEGTKKESKESVENSVIQEAQEEWDKEKY